MKLDKIALANTLALTTAILWVVCSVIVWLLPGLSLLVTRWWIHGLNIGALGSWNLNLSNFLLGGISLTVSMWVTGLVFGWAWEKMSNK